MALPILSCECKTFLVFFSTGLHLCFSGSVKLPGLWLDAAALSLSQQQQHRTARWHPDSPAALPETKLRCFAICCITHQFCLTERHARISVMHWEAALNQSDWGIEPMTWLLRASCFTHRAIGANTAHTAVSEKLKTETSKISVVCHAWSQQTRLVLMKANKAEAVCFAVALPTPDGRKEALLKRELNVCSSTLVLFWDFRCCTCC